MTNAVAGHGTRIGLGNGASPEIFNLIAEVLSIGGPEQSAETIEVTSLDSTAKEYIAGLSDGGSVQIEMNWVNANLRQRTIRDRVSAGTSGNFLITWPDSPQTKVLFTATVESWSISTEPNAAITASATLKVSGLPSWTTTKTVSA